MEGRTNIASIEKHGSDTLYFIKHNLRELPTGKTPSNLEIDDHKRDQNYSIISRGNSAAEINKYRKKITKDLFKYNRKNLVQSVEVCITLPKDCPVDQERAFFQESYNYVVSTLPMGEKCVFLAEVHADEGRIQKDRITIVTGAKHLHIMYVPGVPDFKHEGFQFKLCADQLTKRIKLKEFHPKFQKWLDKSGIKATVNSGVTGGENITVDQLKEITKETGLDLEKIKELNVENSVLRSKLEDKEKYISELSSSLISKDTIITDLRSLISNKEKQILDLQERLHSVYIKFTEQHHEIINLKNKVQSMETHPKERTWGSESCGDRGWNNAQKTYEKEK